MIGRRCWRTPWRTRAARTRTSSPIAASRERFTFAAVGSSTSCWEVLSGQPATISLMKRNVLLVQLPIPPLGPAPIRGNVPLAGAYLKLFCRAKVRPGMQRLRRHRRAARTAGQHPRRSRPAVAGLAWPRAGWMVGFTCYLWNIERTLWIARRLTAACVAGACGSSSRRPEITGRQRPEGAGHARLRFRPSLERGGADLRQPLARLARR